MAKVSALQTARYAYTPKKPGVLNLKPESIQLEFGKPTKAVSDQKELSELFKNIPNLYYTTFYSFKSNGVYLTNLNMINGIAKVRPFISAALLFFMISLMGIAPFPGFIGQLSVLENIVTANSYFILFIALFSMIVLMAAFLQIIRFPTNTITPLLFFYCI